MKSDGTNAGESKEHKAEAESSDLPYLRREDLIEYGTAIERLSRRCQLMTAYLKEDPTFVYDDLEWGGIVDEMLLLWQKIHQVKQLTLHQPEVSEEIRDLLNQAEQSLLPYLSSSYESCLDSLSRAGAVAHGDIITLQSDPVFHVYCRRHPDIKDRYELLRNSNIDQAAKDIFDYSRHLFVSMPESEMVSTKKEECPHYLAISQYFGELNQYVVNEILSHGSVNSRAAAFSFWTQVARRLYNRGDFSSVKAIHSALRYSPALTRLKRSISGMADEDKAFLEALNSKLTKKGIKEEILKRNGHVIPYMGDYSADLEKMKAYRKMVESNAGKDSKESKAHQDKFDEMKLDIVGQLTSMQTKIDVDDNVSSRTSFVHSWGQANLANDEAQRKLSSALFKKSREYEPKGVSGLSSRLLQYNSRSWLRCLRNRTLVNIILEKKMPPSSSVTPAQITSLNEVVRIKLSRSQFRRRLSAVGITLQDRALFNRAHKSNHQLYYHNLIENSTLKQVIQGQVLNRGSWIFSTKGAIKRINRLLRQGASERVIQKALKSVKIAISSRELKAVIAESNRSRMDSPKVALAYLEQQFNRLKSDKELKKQMQSYMMLACSEALPATDKTNLVTNVACVVPGTAIRKAGINPFRERINALLLLANKVQVANNALPADQREPAITRQINQMVTQIRHHNLVKKNALLTRWCRAGGEPDDRLKSEILNVAQLNRRTLSRLTDSDYLIESVDKVRLRTQKRYQPIVDEELIDYFKNDFLPREANLLKLAASPLLSTVIHDRLLTLLTSLDDVTNEEQLHEISTQFNMLMTELNPTVEQFNVAFGDYAEALDSANAYFSRSCHIARYVDNANSSGLNPSTRAILVGMKFKEKVGYLPKSSIDEIKPESWSKKFPQTPFTGFEIVQLLKSINSEIQLKTSSFRSESVSSERKMSEGIGPVVVIDHTRNFPAEEVKTSASIESRQRLASSVDSTSSESTVGYSAASGSESDAENDHDQLTDDSSLVYLTKSHSEAVSAEVKGTDGNVRLHVDVDSTVAHSNKKLSKALKYTAVAAGVVVAAPVAMKVAGLVLVAKGISSKLLAAGAITSVTGAAALKKSKDGRLSSSGYLDKGNYRDRFFVKSKVESESDAEIDSEHDFESKRPE